MYRWFASVLTFACALSLAAADDPPVENAHAKAVAPYVDGQTLAIVHIDVRRVDIDALAGKISEIAGTDGKELTPLKARFGPWIASFTKAGGKDIYCVISLADFPATPFVVAPLSADADAAALTALLHGQEPFHLETVEKIDNVIVAGSKSALARLKGARPVARPEIAQAFAAAGDTAIQALVVPTPEARRVVEETMPRLPRELGGGPSTVLTRGLLWLAAAIDLPSKQALIDLPPKPALKLVIQSENPASAEALHRVLVSFYGELVHQEMVQRIIPHFDRVKALLTPAVDGDRLTLRLDSQSEGAGQLLAELASSFNRAAQRMRTANNLKQIALALHNYHDTYGKFPTAAGYDKNGKPLLSWRVYILPYVEQDRLFKQFHLDEPWDSEHNKTLIPLMPKIYGEQALLGNKEGKTRILAPVGPAMIFTGTPQAVQIKEVTDGTSNTIMVVEATPDHAVTWTKPDDLKIDEKNPAAGLLDERSTGFNLAFADGSVRYINAKIDPKMLYALFTRNGGEVTKFND